MPGRGLQTWNQELTARADELAKVAKDADLDQYEEVADAIRLAVSALTLAGKLYLLMVEEEE